MRPNAAEDVAGLDQDTLEKVYHFDLLLVHEASLERSTHLVLKKSDTGIVARMDPAKLSGTRGIVEPDTGFEHFTLTRSRPGSDLAWAVDRYWAVRWDLRGHEPYRQRVLPYPGVHLVFEGGAAHFEAISEDVFVRRLEGRGQAFGARFRPAGFRPFLGRPVSTIVGQRFPATLIFGSRVDDVAAVVQEIDEFNDLTSVVDDLILSLHVQPLTMTDPVNRIVDHIEADRSITRVDQLAGQLMTTTRRLQRLFADHVGLGPKWVINRFRIHEAAEVALNGRDVDWARLASELGYSDQSHLVREFTAAVGDSPDRYARRTPRQRGDRTEPPPSTGLDVNSAVRHHRE